MKYLFCICLFIGLSITLFSQNSYQEAIQQGDLALKNGQYKTALNKYFSAIAFEPNKRNYVQTEKIEKVFDEIQRLKQEAEIQKEQAVTSAKISQLVAYALEVKDSNPSLAMQLANYAYKYAGKKDAGASKIRRDIYQNISINLLNNVFKGHINPILSVAFAPNGETILTGSADNTAILWDLKGNPLQIFKKHTSGILSVTFAPDGESILTGSYDNTAILWDLNGNSSQTFRRHTSSVFSVAFAPEGKSILTGSNDNTAILWDLKGNPLQIFKGHNGHVGAASFAPSGQSILTGSADKTAILWDLKGNPLQILKGHLEGVSSVAFSPDGQSILTGCMDETAILWDLKGNSIQTFKFESGFILSVTFSPDGLYMLVGNGNDVILNSELITTYFIKNYEFSIYECQKYGLPFNYTTLENSGYIWQYGRFHQNKGYKEENLKLALIHLDTARQVFEFLINNRGEVYQGYIAQLYLTYGDIYFKQEQFERAIAYYQQAIVLDSFYIQWNIYLAITFIYNGEFDKAKTIFNQYKGKAWEEGYIWIWTFQQPKTWTAAFLRYLEENVNEDIQPKDPHVVEAAKVLLRSWVVEK